MEREHRLIAGVDLRSSQGIEIGPLDKPIVPPNSPGIFYVDHADTETLRVKYADDAAVNCDKIVHVDGVWGDKTLAEVCASIAPVDYIVASHVIEHVPDLIGWLRELESVLTPDGDVRLAIPDRRYSFDYLRTETIASDVLAAHVVHARIPQPRQVIDFAHYEVELDCWKAWDEPVEIEKLSRVWPIERTLALGADVHTRGTYHDVHCWVFTPHSFATLMSELARVDLLSFRCQDYLDTAYHSLEFFVTLRRSSDKQEIITSWQNMQNTLGEPPTGGNHEYQALLAELRSSRSWRVTAPLRRGMTLLRKLRTIARIR